VDYRQTTKSSMEGSLSGCPFCAARALNMPKSGDRFRIISGYNAGATGTVVEWPEDYPPRPNEFLSQMDHDDPNVQCRVLLEHEFVQIFPLQKDPDWAPPLCLEDAAELDSVVLYFCNKSLANGSWKLDWQAFYEVIRKAWSLRLPIEPNELWLVLRAHGVPVKWENQLSTFFEKGRDLLVYSVGRKPVKKKRVEPFSI
jgi:hypothetical protein